MTHYTVVYFAIRGRAEPIRLLLASIGAPFEDAPVQRETWPTAKGTMPLGQVPVLIERDADGAERRVPQSQAILRHLGRVHGRYGRDEAAMLRADVLAETMYDVRAIVAPLLAMNVRGKDPAALKSTFEEKLPAGLDRLEKLAPAIAGAPTWADCLVFDGLDLLETISPTVLDRYPALRAFVAAFRAHPSLQGYLAKRAPSEMAPLRRVLETGVPL